jgi:hypothetical protein
MLRAIVDGTTADSRRERRMARRIEGAAAALDALAEPGTQTPESGAGERVSDSDR